MIRRACSFVLRLAACGLRLASIACLLLVLVLVSSRAALALHATPVALSVTRALPSWFAYWGVVASPLGGVFRTDLFFLAVAATIAAGLLNRIAKGVS